jgi:hypothetical protein
MYGHRDAVLDPNVQCFKSSAEKAEESCAFYDRQMSYGIGGT